MTKTKIKFAWYPQIIEGKLIFFKKYLATFEQIKLDVWVGNFTGEWVTTKKWKLKNKKVVHDIKWDR